MFVVVVVVVVVCLFAMTVGSCSTLSTQKGTASGGIEDITNADQSPNGVSLKKQQQQQQQQQTNNLTLRSI